MRRIGYGPHRMWTPPGSKFYGMGPYSIIEFGPTGSIFCREYGPRVFHGVHIIYDTDMIYTNYVYDFMVDILCLGVIIIYGTELLA